jgi:hypothetical protein
MNYSRAFVSLYSNTLGEPLANESGALIEMEKLADLDGALEWSVLVSVPPGPLRFRFLISERVVEAVLGGDLLEGSVASHHGDDRGLEKKEKQPVTTAASSCAMPVFDASGRYEVDAARQCHVYHVPGEFQRSAPHAERVARMWRELTDALDRTFVDDEKETVKTGTGGKDGRREASLEFNLMALKSTSRRLNSIPTSRSEPKKVVEISSSHDVILERNATMRESGEETVIQSDVANKQQDASMRSPTPAMKGSNEEVIDRSFAPLEISNDMDNRDLLLKSKRRNREPNATGSNDDEPMKKTGDPYDCKLTSELERIAEAAQLRREGLAHYSQSLDHLDLQQQQQSKPSRASGSRGGSDGGVGRDLDCTGSKNSNSNSQSHVRNISGRREFSTSSSSSSSFSSIGSDDEVSKEGNNSRDDDDADKSDYVFDINEDFQIAMNNLNRVRTMKEVLMARHIVWFVFSSSLFFSYFIYSWWLCCVVFFKLPLFFHSHFIPMLSTHALGPLQVPLRNVLPIPLCCPRLPLYRANDRQNYHFRDARAVGSQDNPSGLARRHYWRDQVHCTWYGLFCVVQR